MVDTSSRIVFTLRPKMLVCCEISTASQDPWKTLRLFGRDLRLPGCLTTGSTPFTKAEGALLNWECGGGKLLDAALSWPDACTSRY